MNLNDLPLISGPYNEMNHRYMLKKLSGCDIMVSMKKFYHIAIIPSLNTIEENHNA